MDDSPSIAMMVVKGHLVPVAPFDCELLEQYRDNEIVNVSPTRAIVRPLERKYFAMLSRLMREVQTPWLTSQEAHEKIKKMLGFAEPIRLADGTMSTRERRISSFYDDELDEFFSEFCAMVRKRFGVDPEALKSTAALPAPMEQPAVDAPAASPIPAGGGERPAYTEADMQWLKMVARMLVSATEPNGSDEDFQILKRQKVVIKGLTPPTIGTDARAIAEKIYQHCREACNGIVELNPALVANLAGCSEADLRPETR